MSDAEIDPIEWYRMILKEESQTPEGLLREIAAPNAVDGDVLSPSQKAILIGAAADIERLRSQVTEPTPAVTDEQIAARANDYISTTDFSHDNAYDGFIAGAKWALGAALGREP